MKTLLDVTAKLQTDEQCLDFLEKVRWPDGKIRCLRCGNDNVSRITRTVDETKTRKEKKQNKRTRLYACLEQSCKYRFTPTVGTIFHNSHLPLHKWFAAVGLIVHAKKGMSALQMQRHLGVNYRTAWYMGHRIRKSMTENAGITGTTVTPRPKLSGIVEIDETYLGGEQRGHRRKLKNKACVIGLRERGGPVRFTHIRDANSATIQEVVTASIGPEADIFMTDDSHLYPLIFQNLRRSQDHFTVRHSAGQYVRGIAHTNTVESAFSLLQRGIVGSFHQVSRKHLHRYLSEFEYRFNGRKQPDLFTQTVGRMVATPEMKYSELIAN